MEPTTNAKAPSEIKAMEKEIWNVPNLYPKMTKARFFGHHQR